MCTLQGIASVLAATAARFDRLAFCGVCNTRFGLVLRLRVSLATATTGRFWGGCVLGFEIGTAIHLNFLSFRFILKTPHAREHYKNRNPANFQWQIGRCRGLVARQDQCLQQSRQRCLMGSGVLVDIADGKFSTRLPQMQGSWANQAIP